MAFAGTYGPDTAYDLPSEVEEGKDLEVSHGKMQFKTRIDDRIVVPHYSLIAKYSHALRDFIIEVTYTDEEFRQFYQKPKALSLDLYGTQELWSWLLYINNCKSVANFTNPKLKIFTQNIDSAIGEILTLNNEDLKKNQSEVYPDE